MCGWLLWRWWPEVSGGVDNGVATGRWIKVRTTSPENRVDWVDKSLYVLSALHGHDE